MSNFPEQRFPEQHGTYIAERNGQMVLIKVKGVYPTLELDSRGLDMATFIATGKAQLVDKSIMDAIQLFPTSWKFHSMPFLKKFSPKVSFQPNGIVDLDLDTLTAARGRYYRLCQMGISPIKIARALSAEFSVPIEQMLEIVNNFDKEAC